MMIRTELHFHFQNDLMWKQQTNNKVAFKKITARRISDMYTEIQSKYLSNIIPPNLEIIDDCTGFWGTVLVFEHVTQQFLHGSVSDGPVEEQQLYPLRIHKTQRGKKKKQLSEPKNTQETKIKSTSA